jgi:CRP/FNR family cyclic AMP-dependent transcriptional regulator
MTDQNHTAVAKFDPSTFLSNAGLGRKIIQLKPKSAFFSQGNAADAVFYLQKGRAKLTVVSKGGKEATITLLSPGDFIGEEAIAAVAGLHMATACAITACTALKIEREEMIRVMHQEHSFSDMFMAFLLARSMRTQADLVDQLFNSSEKRLARILLLMAEFGRPGEPEMLIPEITQETPRRHDRHHPLPGQLLHESLSQTRLHRIQRSHPRSQVAAQHRPARSTL